MEDEIHMVVGSNRQKDRDETTIRKRAPNSLSLTYRLQPKWLVLVGLAAIGTAGTNLWQTRQTNSFYVSVHGLTEGDRGAAKQAGKET